MNVVLFRIHSSSALIWANQLSSLDRIIHVLKLAIKLCLSAMSRRGHSLPKNFFESASASADFGRDMYSSSKTVLEMQGVAWAPRPARIATLPLRAANDAPTIDSHSY
jgi:hypothetical protein